MPALQSKRSQALAVAVVVMFVFYLRAESPSDMPMGPAGMFPAPVNGPKAFVGRVRKLGRPVTDKVTHHGYDLMYGMYLEPAVASARIAGKPFRLFEIGLGCTMDYGPGASTKIWIDLLKGIPGAVAWQAEFNKECVMKTEKQGLLDGANVVIGDQADPADLARWIKETGGNFDAIIDDGGHNNRMIENSFTVLWGALNPGGFYFVEDMMAGRMKEYMSEGVADFASTVQDWIDQLIILTDHGNDDTNKRGQAKMRHSLPVGVKFITCMAKSCVIAKCLEDDDFHFCPRPRDPAYFD